VVILPAQSFLQTSQSILSYGTISDSAGLLFFRGVNYHATQKLYDPTITTDEILQRDFSRFKGDGLDGISLEAYWYRMESDTRGVYYDDFFDNLKRVINIANQHGLKVLITFIVNFADDGTWATPKYVIDPVTGKNQGLAILRDESMKQAFLDTFTYAVQKLAGTPGIYAWLILNEPRTPLGPEGGEKEMVIDLMQKQRDVVKALDGRLVAARFISTWVSQDPDGTWRYGSHFGLHFNWDPRIFEILDFIGFNTYPMMYPEVFEEYNSIVRDNVNECLARGRRVWITESGYESDDDYQQLLAYQKFLGAWQTLEIDGILFHSWRSDSYDWLPSAPGHGFNLCASYETGEPRPAYGAFLEFTSS
jgi:hypothetical protein